MLTVIRNLTNGIIAGNPIPGTDKSRSKMEKNIQKGYSKFSDVFLISALNGDGVEDIKVRIIQIIPVVEFILPLKIFKILNACINAYNI